MTLDRYENHKKSNRTTGGMGKITELRHYSWAYVISFVPVNI